MKRHNNKNQQNREKSNSSHVPFRKNEAGFTLLGALIGMVIFVLGILSVFSMQTKGITLAGRSLKLTEENAWAQDTIEDLITRPYDDLSLNPPYGAGDEIDPLEPVDFEDGSNPNGFIHTANEGPYTIKWVVFTADHNGKKINDFPAIKNDEMFAGANKTLALIDIPPNAKLVSVYASHPNGPASQFVFVKPNI